MLTLEQAAYRVAEQGGEEREIFIDPATLMLICSILSTLFNAIRLWCQWKQNQKIDGATIKQMCTHPPSEQMVRAILYAGASASPAEIESLDSGYTNRFGEQETEL
jgi:hypothetical protein